MKTNLVVYFLFLFISNIVAQNKIDSQKTEEFYSLFKKYHSSVITTDSIAEKMIELAQTDYEKAQAYLVYGGNNYMNGDYLKTIKLYEKAKNYIVKTDSINVQGDILVGLMVSYRRAGFIAESEAYFETIKKFSSKFPEAQKERGMLYTQMRIYDIDEDFCKAAEVRERHFNLTEDDTVDPERKNRYNFALLAQLTYSQLKCGLFEKANSSLLKVESYLKKTKGNSILMMKDFHMMNKGIIYNRNGNTNLARIYFDSACMYVEKEKVLSLQKLIYNERLNAKIDNDEQTLFYLRKIKDLNSRETSVTKEIAAKEAIQKQKVIKNKQQNISILSVIVFITAVVLFFLIIFYRKKQKLLRDKYHQIILELRQSKVVTHFEVKVEKALADKPEDFISEEKELLKSLESFERKKLFTTKSISAAQMAVMLKTNTKYLSYILKKFRGDDFYTYINTCRINFIIKELTEKPELLQYKIAVLSDICGYNTHSQFASNFKNIKGISPSEFIHFLLKDQNKN